MKPNIRAHYINQHNLNMRRLETHAHKLILRAYRRQKPKVVDFVRSGGSVKELQHQLKEFYALSIRPMWKFTLTQIWQHAAEEADGVIREWISPESVKKAWTDAAKDWMDQWGAGRIDSITGSDLSRMNTILSDGAAQGLTAQEIAGNLNNNFEELTTGRAMTIARTETQGAYSYAALDAAKDVAPNWSKEWATTSEKPRDAHDDADGQVVEDLEEPFDVGGEELMYPGDPSGSEENVINCQCVVMYNAPTETSGGASEESAGAEPEGEGEAEGAGAEEEVPTAEDRIITQDMYEGFYGYTPELSTLPQETRSIEAFDNFNDASNAFGDFIKYKTGDYPVQYEAMREWITNYGDFQDALRYGEVNSNADKYLPVLESIVQNGPQYEGAAYRGFAPGEKLLGILNDAQPGDVILDRGFTATTTDQQFARDIPGVAARYYGKPEPDVKVVYTIENARGAALPGVGQHEVLLPPSTELEVINKKEESWGIELILRQR